jgi:hypothetical protein
MPADQSLKDYSSKKISGFLTQFNLRNAYLSRCVNQSALSKKTDVTLDATRGVFNAYSLKKTAQCYAVGSLA